MAEYSVEYFENENGEKPAKEFIDSLSPKGRAKIARLLTMIEEFGVSIREPYPKKLQDEIFELREKTSEGQLRVLYFFVIGKRIILTHGFIKKTNRTPLAEIERAKAYRAVYFKKESGK